MSDEARDPFYTEMRAVMSDLEGHAPRAPRLEDITAGRARLTAIPPASRWSRPLVALAAAAVAVIVVGVAALLGSGTDTPNNTVATPVADTTATSTTTVLGLADIQGVWVLDQYTFQGETVSGIDATATGYSVPYVEIRGDEVLGNTGCNDFESLEASEFDGSTLTLNDVIMTAVGCIGRTAEPAMSAAMWSSGGISVTVEGDTMVWSNDSVELQFVRRERRPIDTTTSIPPRTSTTLPSTTSTTLSSTTSIPDSDPQACNASDMGTIDGHVLVQDPGSYEGLPEPVLDTRRALIESALACDFDAIVDLATVAAQINVDDAIFWGAAGSTETLIDYNAQYGSLGRLVVALTRVPFSQEEWDPLSNGEREVFYSWPAPARIPDGGSLTDIWDNELIDLVADLNDTTPAELIRAADSFGAYAGFRIGIAETGRWMFALSGD